MKVLFSNPPWWEEASDGRLLFGVRAGSRWPFTMRAKFHAPDRFGYGDYMPYPFFMGYATTYARKATGYDVRMRDSVALGESEATFFRYLEQERFDYIFIESATPSWQVDKAILGEIHRRLPATRLVVCGPIAANSREVLETPGVVACMQGEYEKNSVKVLGGKEGLIPHDLLTKAEMNDSPFPYYDEAIAHNYYDPSPRGMIAPHAHVWSSRGCPYKCIFCVWPATMTGNDPDGNSPRTVRHYTADYMEAFLTELVERYGFKSIYFDDDTFNLGTKHVKAMCGVMQKIGLPWSAMCRADTVTLETWGLMKESGCYGVKIGFESGNQEVLDKIVNKHLNLEEARRVVEECKRLGLSVHGTFTYGLPGETVEQMHETRRFRESLGLDTYQESGAAEIEGTPLAALSQQGHLKAYEGAHIDEHYRRGTNGTVKFQQLADELKAR